MEFKDIPLQIIQSFLAAEDDSFYEHKGINIKALLRALVADLKAMKIVQGGSTITQQLAKTLLLTREKSFIRKIKDFLLAIELEKKFNKDEILFLYLNQVYLGAGYYGIKTAFKGYFDKELTSASVGESALMAGLLVAPSRYSPILNPPAAKKRQEYVLKRMLETRKITKEEYDKARKEKVKIISRKKNSYGIYFTEWVRNRVMEVVGEEKFNKEGVEVTTTLNVELQKIAEKSLIAGLRDLDKKHGFVGVTKTLKESEEIEKFFSKTRESIFKEASTFFYLTPEGEQIWEIPFEMKSLNKILDYHVKENKKYNSEHFESGIFSEDTLLKFLKANDLHEALVTRVDDLFQLVYVSIAGVKGVIPLEGFKWAHPRQISGSEDLPPPAGVVQPSQILKVGDVIQVKILKLAASAWDQAGKNKLKFNDQKIISAIKKQKFILCALEQEPVVQGALVALEAQTGKILALVGGSNFEKSQFNRATQARRQPGSAYKPLIYAAGLERNYHPASILIDTPQALAGTDEGLSWKPRNYDGEYKGPITYRQALEESRNIPTIKLAETLGVSTLKEITERFGITEKLPNNLSIALGSFGVTPLELTAAYAIFANGGKRIPPQAIMSIKDQKGKMYSVPELMGKNLLAPDQVYDPKNAFIMSNLLKGVVQRGTATAARSLSSFIGGKTGTTNDFVDAWFVGFSPHVVVGVWVGFDDNKTLGYGETGGKTALPIWMNFMAEALKKYPQSDFVIPEGVVQIMINRGTGKPIVGHAGAQSYLESFVQGTEPGKGDIANPQNVEIYDDEYYNNL
ncbi:MAG: PBP1A family penicillin-binding protein [Bacteriovoracaceae bacterium]|nr:PBP1A family penicillin-binding protein [Bacteriovoracaceae bacterium]